MYSLNRMLNPQRVCVIGGKEAERVVEQCFKLGFTGEIWPVSARRERLAGIECFRDLSLIPGVPDVAFIAIPAEASIDHVAQLAAMGAGGVVCYASGFSELGAASSSTGQSKDDEAPDQTQNNTIDGRDRQRRLIAAAGEMPVLGPNCYGFLNLTNGAALWPDQHGAKRCDSGVAIISQSGNIGINLTMQRRALPLAWMVTVGNQANTGVEAVLEAAIADTKIGAIGMYLEGIADLPRFIAAARAAQAAHKPIVIVKVGKSAISQRLTVSHTATLAGESGLYSALFDELGVVECDDVEILVETLKVLNLDKPISGNRLASMSCSGGEASLIADVCRHQQLLFPALTDAHKASVADTLGAAVTVDNPLDYHTYIWGDDAAMQTTFSAMLAGDFDVGLLLLDFPRGDRCDDEEWEQAVTAFAAACIEQGRQGAVITSLPESLPESTAERLYQQNILPLFGMAQGLQAIANAWQVQQSWQRLDADKDDVDQIGQPYQSPKSPTDTAQRVVLDEWQSKQRIAEAGIVTPASAMVNDVAGAREAANKLAYPLVLKAVSSELTHKSEHNAVVVGIRDEVSLVQEVERLFTLSDDVLVERMVDNALVEIIVGVNYDAQFGHYIIVGAGGVLVELLKDSAVLLLPLTPAKILRALQSLLIWPLLNGYRGKAKADVDALVAAVMALANYVQQADARIAEIDINPLLVLPQGEGVVAVDALITLAN